MPLLIVSAIFIGVFFKEMPVATVAQAMINDSYKYFSSPPESGAANNFVISNNRAIYQSAEVLSIRLCLVTKIHLFYRIRS